MSDGEAPKAEVSEYELRKAALDLAVRTHGPDSLAVDVMETASIYYRWLRTPARTPRPVKPSA